MARDEVGLVRALAANPSDDTARLAYADWLQENRIRPHQEKYLRSVRRHKFVRIVKKWGVDGVFGVRPTIPEHIEKFLDYYQHNPAWDSLHIVLDDGNIQDNSVTFCISNAAASGDNDGVILGYLLLQMTKTQRGKIPDVVNRLFRSRGMRYDEEIRFGRRT